MALSVVCMRWGTAFDPIYVSRLRAAVSRCLPVRHDFICLTDGADPVAERAFERQGIEIQSIGAAWPLAGNWPQMELFRPGRFGRGARILCLDLDTLIVGDLTPVIEQTGAINLRDWGWHKDMWFGGAMVWDDGEHPEFWREPNSKMPWPLEGWMREGVEKNIQDWMTYLGRWKRLPAHLIRSYRYHSIERPPVGAAAICFHGRPKPHEVTGGWVPEVWRGVL